MTAISISESGRKLPLVAEPKIKTCVAPMLRSRFAAARIAFFSMKAVAILILRQPVPLARFARSDYTTASTIWNRTTQVPALRIPRRLSPDATLTARKLLGLNAQTPQTVSIGIVSCSG